MTSHRIGILKLQGIIILILTHRLISFLLRSQMSIILIHSLIKSIGLLIGKRGALRLKSIQNNLRRNLLIIIIRKRDACLGEMKPVTFLKLGNLQQFGYISVCNIIHPLNILHKLITVLHNHQLIITDKPFLLELDSRADTEIILDGPLVRATENYSLILTIIRISISYLLYQIAARDTFDIIKSIHLQTKIAHIHDSNAILEFRYKVADQSSIMQNT